MNTELTTTDRMKKKIAVIHEKAQGARRLFAQGDTASRANRQLIKALPWHPKRALLLDLLIEELCTDDPLAIHEMAARLAVKGYVFTNWEVRNVLRAYRNEIFVPSGSRRLGAWRLS